PAAATNRGGRSSLPTRQAPSHVSIRMSGRHPDHKTPETMTPQITIAHHSDVHLAPPAAFSPSHWNAKRFLGVANWVVRRRKSHLRAVVDLLTLDLRHQDVDHIAVSGDLINIGLPQEYETALL